MPYLDPTRLHAGVELDALAFVETRNGAGRRGQPRRPGVRAFSMARLPAVVAGHERADLAGGGVDGRASQVTRELVVAPSEIGIADLGSLRRRMDQPLDRADDGRTGIVTQIRPMGDDDTHQVADQCTIDREHGLRYYDKVGSFLGLVRRNRLPAARTTSHGMGNTVPN